MWIICPHFDLLQRQTKHALNDQSNSRHQYTTLLTSIEKGTEKENQKLGWVSARGLNQKFPYCLCWKDKSEVWESEHNKFEDSETNLFTSTTSFNLRNGHVLIVRVNPTSRLKIYLKMESCDF